MKLWRCIQFDSGYCMGYFSTSGQILKTGSWLFCYETDYISVSKFSVSHQKVSSSRLDYLPIQVKPEILVKTGSFHKVQFMTSRAVTKMPNIFNFWKQMYSADSSVDENSPTQFFQIVFLFGRNRQQIRIEHKIPPRCFIMADFRLRESVKFFLIM